MHRLVATLLLVLFLGVHATDAFACRVLVPIPYQITGLRKDNLLQGIVVGRVTEASLTPSAPGNYPSWTGKVEVVETLSGRGDLNDLRIGESGLRTACAHGFALPEIGDLWVLYLIDRNGKLYSGLIYPVEVAKKADPVIEPLLSQRPR